MSESEVQSALIDRLASSRGNTRDEVLLDLECVGAIDSLEGVELVIEAERIFGITISDHELSSEVCRSIPDLVALIHSKLSPSIEAIGRASR